VNRVVARGPAGSAPSWPAVGRPRGASVGPPGLAVAAPAREAGVSRTLRRAARSQGFLI